jgi:hypothetical protein
MRSVRSLARRAPAAVDFVALSRAMTPLCAPAIGVQGEHFSNARTTALAHKREDRGAELRNVVSSVDFPSPLLFVMNLLRGVRTAQFSEPCYGEHAANDIFVGHVHLDGKRRVADAQRSHLHDYQKRCFAFKQSGHPSKFGRAQFVHGRIVPGHACLSHTDLAGYAECVQWMGDEREARAKP